MASTVFFFVYLGSSRYFGNPIWPPNTWFSHTNFFLWEISRKYFFLLGGWCWGLKNWATIKILLPPRPSRMGELIFPFAPPPNEGGIWRLGRGLEINFSPDSLTNLWYFCQFAHKFFFRLNWLCWNTICSDDSFTFCIIYYIISKCFVENHLFSARLWRKKLFSSISGYPPPYKILSGRHCPTMWLSYTGNSKNQYCHLGGADGAPGSF